MKNALYLGVNVFSTKVLIGTLYFTSPNGDGTTILRGHPGHAKVQPSAGQRKYLHFSVIFKTLRIGPAPGIEPATSRSAVKRSTDWANPAAVNWSSISETLGIYCQSILFGSKTPEGSKRCHQNGVVNNINPLNIRTRIFWRGTKIEFVARSNLRNWGLATESSKRKVRLPVEHYSFLLPDSWLSRKEKLR